MVFGVLAAVAVFMAFYPKRPEFFLFRLSKSFGIAERAREYPIKNEWFFVRSALERARLDAYFPWQYAHFDVNIDNEGVWMSFVGPDPGKCAPSLLVPWHRIRFVKHWLNHSYFTFLADEPVGITVRKSMGETMTRYMAPWKQLV
jgi:hypothetical protein